MAINQELWNKAKEYFEAGLSLTEIVDRTNISKSQISKRATKEQWEKGNEKKQLITQAVEVAIKKETLKETALEVHNELVSDELRRKNLVFNATEKIIKKATQILDSNKVVDKLNCGDGIQNFEPRELNTTDLKNLSDTIDKASITLGVNQRHSNSQINVNTQNNIQTNLDIDNMTDKEITQTYMDIIKK
jgi:predicted DNA-binding protein YlxM (UPF0122 family)